MSYKIAAFYRFESISEPESLKFRLLELMEEFEILGTFIIASEGYNATVAGIESSLDRFMERLREILPGEFAAKYSYHHEQVFRRSKVKIKPEIVTIRNDVDMSLASGSHVNPEDWDELIKAPDMLVVDTRNDYEFMIGTFDGAVNPKIEKFSDLPSHIEENYPPESTPRIATFCTGGIRCEKLVPLLKETGYQEVYQLDGGILDYFAKTGNRNGVWDGDCFVFDERVSVRADLKQGTTKDFSDLKPSARPAEDKAEGE